MLCAYGLVFPILCDLFFNDKSFVNNFKLRKKKQTLLLLLHAYSGSCA